MPRIEGVMKQKKGTIQNIRSALIWNKEAVQEIGKFNQFNSMVCSNEEMIQSESLDGVQSILGWRQEDRRYRAGWKAQNT